MYLSHYRLSAKPFEINTDPRFLWLEGDHKEALANLRYGLMACNGYAVLVGAVGTGKTTLVNALLQMLDDRVIAASINFTSMAPAEFLSFIARTYAPDVPVASKADSLLSIKAFLDRANERGKQVLLVIDEAHRLSESLLEQIRLLSNMERNGIPLINIFFVGQTELKDHLLSHQCRALRQRITLFYHLKPLSEAETGQYIAHRLKVAGCEATPFTPEALRSVHRYARGYPRLINKICDRAMLTGFARDQDIIDVPVIAECAREIRSIDPVPSRAKMQNRLQESPTRPDISSLWKSLGGLFSKASLKAKLARDAAKQRILKTSAAARTLIQDKALLIVAVNVSMTALLVGVTLMVGFALYRAGNPGAGAPGHQTYGIVQTADNPDTIADPDRVRNLDQQTSALASPLSVPGLASVEVQMTAMLTEGDYQSAIELIENETDPGVRNTSVENRLYARALAGRAAQLKESSPDEAEVLLKRAVSADPRNVEALTALGDYFIHTVTNPGETLIAVARWYTGNANNWPRIKQANPNMDPRRIPIGSAIRIPERIMIRLTPMPASAITGFSATKTAQPSGEPPDSFPAPQLFGPIETTSSPISNGTDGLPRPLQRLDGVD